jgi:hypothetical protein
MFVCTTLDDWRSTALISNSVRSRLVYMISQGIDVPGVHKELILDHYPAFVLMMKLIVKLLDADTFCKASFKVHKKLRQALKEARTYVSLDHI